MKNNDFVFKEEIFQQIVGTATGTIVPPAYATLVLGYHEIQFFEHCNNEFILSNGKHFKENWSKILYDCYIALHASNISPLKLFDILNNIHDNINLTMKQHSHFLISW